jgi:thiamine-phosphate pyrophosphorylase
LPPDEPDRERTSCRRLLHDGRGTVLSAVDRRLGAELFPVAFPFVDADSATPVVSRRGERARNSGYFSGHPDDQLRRQPSAISIPECSPTVVPVIDRENPILCYVTDWRSLPATSMASVAQGVLPTGGVADDAEPELSRLVAKIAAIAAAGVDWVQIREKGLPARSLAALTRDAIARTQSDRRPGARVIVNDRVDIAVAEGAGGVHLGEAGLRVADVAQWTKRASAIGAASEGVSESSRSPVGLSSNFLIGASCHSLEGAKAAVRDGADYVFFGPVFATPSKVEFGEPQGLKKLAVVCEAVAAAVIAIGGITLENAGECVVAGASGIAAIRLFQDAPDPARIVSALKKLRR